MTGRVGRAHWPLFAGLASYWAAVTALVWQSLVLNQGHLVYPLDDAYIHMAIAKNTVLHGVWGVTRHEFTSSTSSPLWSGLLAAVYWVSGVGSVAPLALNVVCGSLIVAVSYALVRRWNGASAWTFLVLMVVVFLGAVPTLTILGMEHTLHALVTLAFLSIAADVISPDRQVSWRRGLLLSALAAALTAVRYEGIFAVLTVVLVLVGAGRLRWGVTVGVAGAVPPSLYGLWSVFHGWYLLPTSVLLKGNMPEFTAKGLVQVALWWRAANALVETAHLFVLVVVSLAALIGLATRHDGGRRRLLLGLFVAITFLHLEFAKTGWFYRYEAYLVVVGLAILGVAAADSASARGFAWTARYRWYVRAAAALLAIVLTAPVAMRGVRALRLSPRATHNIFEQQYQMGLFLNRYYAGKTVAANDIGAVTYLADVKLVDLYGLGTLEVAQMVRDRRLTSSQIATLGANRNVDIAIAYDSWLNNYGGAPAAWHKVGEWTVHDNVVLGENTVSFYAVRDALQEALAGHLREFAPNLPADVESRVRFTPDR